jgi:hypothetical protein
VPIATILAFVYLNAAWAIVTGVLMLAAVSRLHRTHGKWILALRRPLAGLGRPADPGPDPRDRRDDLVGWRLCHHLRLRSRRSRLPVQAPAR